MKKAYGLLMVCLFAIGCGAAMDTVNPPGQMRADGTIVPCHGYVMNEQACGNAIFNAKVIGKVSAGQTKDEVRSIMAHDPERREFNGSEEEWSYITDYDREIMTTIVFTDAKVTAMKQTAWRSE